MIFLFEFPDLKYFPRHVWRTQAFDPVNAAAAPRHSTHTITSLISNTHLTLKCCGKFGLVFQTEEPQCNVPGCSNSWLLHLLPSIVQGVPLRECIRVEVP